MWPFKKTKYPRQVLHPKQLALIEWIDNELVELHKDKPVSGLMSIRYVGVDFRTALLPLSFITDKIKLESGDSYIPRSVAFLTDSCGNWFIYYAIRTETGADELLTTLFIDFLNRTNTARNSNEL